MRYRHTSAMLAAAAAMVFSFSGVGLAQSTAPDANGLQAAWDRLQAYPGLADSSVSAYAYDITTGQMLAEIHPQQRETPASVTKLFTSAAALSLLGPDFRYQTVVKATANTIDHGAGAVYLVGGGDPWLEAHGAANLQSLATQVAKTVKRATAVVGISTLFTPPSYGIGWPYGDLAENYAAGTTALMAERSELFVTVNQADQAGVRPEVTLSFNGSLALPGYFDVVNHAVTADPGSANTLAISRRLGTNQIVVTGQIPLSLTSTPNSTSAVLSVGNPPLFAATLFQAALVRDGVKFSAEASVGSVVPTRVTTLAEHTSAPLAAYLKIQNQYSINQMAENLYRELGVRSQGVGSLTAASAFMQSFSVQAGISPARVQLDGSGLSPLDETSAQEVVELLTYVARQSWFQTFRASLMQLNSTANCGILCPPAWTYHLPSNAKIWVKTGNLSNQWNYAGFTRAGNGNLIAFAVLDDGSPTSDNAYPGSPVDQMMADTAFWPAVPLAPAAQDPSAPPITAVGSALASALEAKAPPPALGSIVGAAVVNVATGKTVFSEDGNVLMSAGLVPRLILADAALRHLEPGGNSATVAETGSVASGRLDGSLVIDGHDDSDLTTVDLQALAAKVRKAGVTVVDGGLEYVNRETGFQASRWPSGMPWNDIGKAWTPPASSLAVNDDQAILQVRAGRLGQPGSVTISPALTPITVQNQTQTVAGGPSTVTARLALASDRYIVSGVVAKGTSVQRSIAPPDPGRYAAVMFLSDLRSLGVTVKGGVTEVATDPSNAIIAESVGPTPAEQVASMLLSANTTSPMAVSAALGAQLWPDLGAVLGTEPNYLVDPTGAALSNYLTADGVATILAKAWSNPSEAPMTRMLRQSLWKTASPEEYAIAGYMKGPSGGVYAVSLMVSELLWNHHFTATVQS